MSFSAHSVDTVDLSRPRRLVKAFFRPRTTIADFNIKPHELRHYEWLTRECERKDSPEGLSGTRCTSSVYLEERIQPRITFCKPPPQQRPPSQLCRPISALVA